MSLSKGAARASAETKTTKIKNSAVLLRYARGVSSLPGAKTVSIPVQSAQSVLALVPVRVRRPAWQQFLEY